MPGNYGWRGWASVLNISSSLLSSLMSGTWGCLRDTHWTLVNDSSAHGISSLVSACCLYLSSRPAYHRSQLLLWNHTARQPDMTPSVSEATVSRTRKPQQAVGWLRSDKCGKKAQQNGGAWGGRCRQTAKGPTVARPVVTVSLEEQCIEQREEEKQGGGCANSPTCVHSSTGEESLLIPCKLQGFIRATLSEEIK